MNSTKLSQHQMTNFLEVKEIVNESQYELFPRIDFEENSYTYFTYDMQQGLLNTIRRSEKYSKLFKDNIVTIEKGKKFTEEDKEKSNELLEKVYELVNSGEMKMKIKRGREYGMKNGYKQYFWNFELKKKNIFFLYYKSV